MNAEQLVAAGYKIENAKITSVDLSMADHGCLTLSMVLDGVGNVIKDQWFDPEAFFKDGRE